MTESTQPPSEPGPSSAWTPPPAGVVATASQEVVVARSGPSGSVVAAGVILLVIATLVGIFALLILFLGAMLGQMQGIFTGSGLTPEEQKSALAMGRIVVIAVGGIGLLFALGHLMSGIGVLLRRGWARILGLVMSVLGILVWTLALVGNIVASTQRIPAGVLADSGLTAEEYRSLIGAGWLFGVGISAVALAMYLFVLVVLIRRGREFG